MTKKIYSTFAMLGLFLVLAVGSIQAQSEGSLEVNIRFDFQVGSKVLPAGEYTVRRLSQNSMIVESADGSERVIAQVPGRVERGRKTDREKLVFHQYGDQYFLAQIWMVRDGDGRELTKSKAEREASKAQTLARGDEKPRTVEITASAH
jgi:hypothetical protein